MKLMRGYRFRREAFKMLKAFLLVWIAAFGIEVMSDWAKGQMPSVPMLALALSALAFMLLAAALLAVDAVIQSAEQKRGTPWPDHVGDGPRQR